MQGSDFPNQGKVQRQQIHSQHQPPSLWGIHDASQQYPPSFGVSPLALGILHYKYINMKNIHITEITDRRHRHRQAHILEAYFFQVPGPFWGKCNHQPTACASWTTDRTEHCETSSTTYRDDIY